MRVLHIGTAAFDYQFGALAQADNAFMKAYFGLMQAFHSLGSPSLVTYLPLFPGPIL